MPEIVWILLALIAFALLLRWVLALLRRYATLIAVAVLVAIVLPRCDGTQIPL